MEFTIKTNIKASAKMLYNAWLNSEQHSAMTVGKAEVSDKPGAEFTAWDGYISGTNVHLVPYERIVQKWRTTEFLEYEEDSDIEILFSESDDSTDITLIHSNLSTSGTQYRSGWENHYFIPMKEYFSKR